ncbi:MAG: hypothetical protein CMB76_02970 [Euryarchaeota archaeon]|nr:hypothetical protein [Euryarchaeota archaeon]|tara:strand:+ start:2660 stop:3250 length:591 start_codon:yes stop_codon:yes gene_type:complete
MADFFDRPSPGESLVVEPKSRPYERPAEMSKLSEVIDFYISRITSDEVIDNTIEMLDMGVPIEVLVESMTTFFVMQGKHSMDNKMLISPVLHEYVRMLGKQAGVQVVDGLNPDSQPQEDATHLAEKVRMEIEKVAETEEDDEGVDLMRQTADMLDDDLEQAEPPLEEMPIEEEPMPQEMPTPEQMPNPEMGIMSRR